MLLSVSAKALHQRTLRVGKERHPGATMFPCFDQAGNSSHVLIIHRDSDQIFLLPWRPGDFANRWFSAMSLRVETAWLKPITEEAVADLDNHWHFDPWWLLTAPRFEKHWAVPPLRATNAVGRFNANVCKLWYHRNLGRITWIQVRSHSEFNLQRWRPSLLPDQRTTRDSKTDRRRTVGWQFDPVWQNGNER
jgi:hypothetical protein